MWHLQTPLNCMAEDAAVFMELRHWKADKKKVRAHFAKRSCGNVLRALLETEIAHEPFANQPVFDASCRPSTCPPVKVCCR